METRRFLIKVTEKSTKDGAKKFNTYKTFSKNGRPTEVKFRQDVTPLPKEDCVIECLENCVNLNTSGRFPVLWISAIERVVPREELNAENEEKNRAKLADYFG